METSADHIDHNAVWTQRELTGNVRVKVVVVVVMMTIMGKMEKRDDLSFRNRALYRSA
jgi:hypothetical protein